MDQFYKELKVQCGKGNYGKGNLIKVLGKELYSPVFSQNFLKM